MRPLSRLLLLLLVATAPAVAQRAVGSSRDTTSPFWLTLGVGPGHVGDGELGFGFGISAALQLSESTLGALRVATIKEFRLCIFGPCSDEPVQQTEIAALYGLIDKGRYGYFAASAGAGVVFGRDYLPDGERTFVTPALAVDAQAFWTPTSFFGVGLYGYGSANVIDPTGGILLAVQFGRLR